MPIGQLQYPEWIGKGEPAGAALARGAQAGAAIAGSFTSAYNASQNRKLAERHFDLQEEEARLQRMKFGAELYMQSKAQRDQGEGEVEWAKWNAQYGNDPIEMMNAPMPKSEYAAQRAAAAKVGASQTTLAKQYAENITQFNKRLSSLDGDLASLFYGAVKGYPTPDQWKAVGLAEETMAQRKKTIESQQLAEKEKYLKERLQIQQTGMNTRAEMSADAKLQVAQTRIQEATARWAGHVNLANFKARMDLLKEQSKWMDNAQVIEAADRIWKESFGNEPGAPATNPNPVTPGDSPPDNSDPLGLF